MTQPYKICPNCNEPAAVSTAACLRCGRVYRTTAPPPMQQMQVFNATNSPTVSTVKRYAPWACCALPVCILIGLMAIGNIIERRSPPGPETLKLLHEMQPYDARDDMTFLQRFGGPDELLRCRMLKANCSFYTYRCKDGEVTVIDNTDVRLIASISAVGKRLYGENP